MDNNNKEKDYIALLDTVLVKSNSNYIGKIKKTDEIPALLLRLYTETDLVQLQSILSQLIVIIQNCLYISTILSSFTLEPDYPNMTFPKILITLYLKWHNDTLIQNSIDQLLKLLLANCSVHYSICDIVYQSLSMKYYHYHNNSPSMPLLAKEDYFLHQQILMLLFKYNSNMNNNDYFYFTGHDKLFIDFNNLRTKSKQSKDSSRIKFTNSLTVVFWINFQYSMKDLQLINNELNNDSNSKDRGIRNILFSFHSNNVSIILSSNLELILNNHIKKSFCSFVIKERQWYQFTIKLYKTNAKSSLYYTMLQISNSNETKEYKTEEKDSIQLNGDISLMTFFENHIGMVKGIMCLSDFNDVIPFDFDVSSIVSFAENNQLTLFGQNNNKSIELGQKIVNSLILAYSPLYFTENNRRFNIEDLSINKITGVIELVSLYSSGINHNCLNENEVIASMNNLLPILELITLNEDLLKDQAILTSFFNLVSNLLLSLPNDIIGAPFNKVFIDEFFSVVGLFMKSIPIEVYTTDFFDFLIETGKNIYRTHSSENYKEYFSNVIMTQLVNHPDNKELWNNFLNSKQFSLILKNIEINDLFAVLKEIDLLYCKNICCDYHSQILEPVTDIVSHTSNLGEKIKQIVTIIQKKINNLTEFNNTHIALLLGLMIDYSPCIQKAIINIFLSFFDNKDDNSIRKATLNNLLLITGIEILLFVFSNGTYDIKNDILKLIIVLDTDYSDVIKDYINEIKEKEPKYLDNIWAFIRENVIIKVPCSSNIRSICSSIDEPIIISNKGSLIDNYGKVYGNSNTLSSNQNSNKQSMNSKPEFIRTKSVMDNKVNQIEIEDFNQINPSQEMKTSFNNEFVVLESKIRNPSCIISNRKLSKASNTSQSYQATNNKNPRCKTQFLEVNHSNPIIIKEIVEIFNTLVNWLKELLKQDKEEKIRRVMNLIIKLVSETKQTDLLMNFIKVIIENKATVLQKINIMDVYHYLIETAFHCHLSINMSDFKSAFVDHYNNSKDNKEIKEKLKQVETGCLDLICYINKTLYERGETLITQLNYLNNWSFYQQTIIKENSTSEELLYLLEQFLSLIYTPIIEAYYDENDNSFYPKYGISNYLILVNNAYELLFNSLSSSKSNFESILISHDYLNIISTMNTIDLNQIEQSLNIKWAYYNFFNILYIHHHKLLQAVSKVDINSLHIQLEISKIVSHLQSNNEDEQLLMNNFSDLFVHEIQVDNKTIQVIPLIKIIAHFLMITITISDTKQIIDWIKEFQQFIILCLLIDTESNKAQFTTVIQEILSFSILFLFEKSIEKRESVVIQETFSLILFTINEINEQFKSTEKKTFTQIFLSNNDSHKNNELLELLSQCKCDYKSCDIQLYISLHSSQLANIFKSNPSLTKLAEQFYNNSLLEKKSNKRKESCKKMVLYYNNIIDSDTSIIIDSESIPKVFQKIKNEIENKAYSFCKDTIATINNYHLNLEITTRKRMHLYRNTKKALFSWNSNWSNRKLFLEQSQLLKYKLYNHYSSEYYKPIIVPILDFETYFPKFPKYDVKELFQTEYKYNINLNVGIIFKEDTYNKIKTIKESLKEKENSLKDSDRIVKANYPTTYNNILKLTSNAYNKRIHCCLVKLPQHIMGFFHLLNECIEFDNIQWYDDLKESILFDKTREMCFCAFKNNNEKYKYMAQKRINYDDIYLLTKIRYCYMNSGMQILTKAHKCYLFVFDTNEDRDQQFKGLSKYQSLRLFLKINNNDIAYCHNSFPYSSLNDMMFQWQNNKISTIEYLMVLNLLSSRSFQDLSQYPVFPWTLNNYSLPPVDESSLRDFGLPVGMIVLKDQTNSLKRKNDYIKKYNSRDMSNEIESENYYFGSTYSNNLYTTYYLIRLFPFPQVMIELQSGKFDNPNRMFLSFESSFSCASTQVGDLRELIPELFYLPELFVNINNINVGKVADPKMKIFNHVDMPSWCNKSPIEFVACIRENLEKVSGVSINKWVDIIFGIKQKGRKANKIGNVFMNHTYENTIQLQDFVDEELKLQYCGMYEYGVIPSQILFNETSPRTQQNNSSIMTTNKVICCPTDIILQNNNSSKPLAMFFMLNGSDNKSYAIVFDDFQVKIINMIKVKNNYKYTIDNPNSNGMINSKQIEKNNICINSISLKAQFIFDERNSQKYPIGIFNREYIVIGGYWDGSLLINKVMQNKKTYVPHFIFSNHSNKNNLITHIEVDSGNNIVICGTYFGSINLYKILKEDLSYFSTLYNHKKKITFLSLNTTLNLLASSSADGLIYLYTIPSFTIIRAFHMPSSSYADVLFLSSSPLPCITYYINAKSTFYSYTINGSLISEVIEQKERSIIITPVVYKDNHLCEYLCYFTGQGTFRIRKFPLLNLQEHNIFKNKTFAKLLTMTDDKESIFIYDINSKEIKTIQEPLSKVLNDKIHEFGF